ncbi:MAG: hypothetical protein IPP37_11395 [Saprospiraceae bacterium]|nr:hypothetical protein [Saprospiraceae bacterium]
MRIYFGDYTNLSVHDGVIRPIWTRLHNGELSIWTHIARLDEFVNSTGTQEFNQSGDVGLENYPNPSTDIEYVSFKLHESANVNLYPRILKGALWHGSSEMKRGDMANILRASTCQISILLTEAIS